MLLQLLLHMIGPRKAGCQNERRLQKVATRPVEFQASNCSLLRYKVVRIPGASRLPPNAVRPKCRDGSRPAPASAMMPSAGMSTSPFSGSGSPRPKNRAGRRARRMSLDPLEALLVLSRGMTVPGVGNEPGNSLKGSHWRWPVGVIPTHPLPIEPARTRHGTSTNTTPDSRQASHHPWPQRAQDAEMLHLKGQSPMLALRGP